MLLGAALCAANLPATAAEWQCGTDIFAANNGQADLANRPAPVLRDVQLNIDAIDAFSVSDLPGKLFRLADLAFVRGVEDAARAWLEQARANRVSVVPLAKQADFLGRTPVLIDDPFVGDWREELLTAGLAILVPETGQGISHLINVEDSAIQSRAGMWSDREAQTAYYVVADGAATGDFAAASDAIGRFVVIDGMIRSIEHQEWRSYLNFGSNWREDFTIALDATLRDNFGQGDDFQGVLDGWVGQKVRVRGVIENRGGPYIALDNSFWLCLFQDEGVQ